MYNALKLLNFSVPFSAWFVARLAQWCRLRRVATNASVDCVSSTTSRRQCPVGNCLSGNSNQIFIEQLSKKIIDLSSCQLHLRILALKINFLRKNLMLIFVKLKTFIIWIIFTLQKNLIYKLVIYFLKTFAVLNHSWYRYSETLILLSLDFIDNFSFIECHLQPIVNKWSRFYW